MKRWTEEEIEFLKNNTNLNISEIANYLGKTYNSVRMKSNEMKINLARKNIDSPFTEQEFLEAVKNSTTHSEAAAKLGSVTSKPSIKKSFYSRFLIELKPDISHFTMKSNGAMKRNSEELKTKEHEARLLFTRYKTGSTNLRKNKIKDFELSVEEFILLATSNCFYCGSDGDYKHNGRTVSGKFKHKICGLDRIDSSKGYILSNVVPCCKMCNTMKLDYIQTTFINKIIKIYNNLNLGELNTNG